MELSSSTLEAELAAIADAAEPGRTAQIAVRHWGWDGRGGATLETTGREFGGITRERARQLCERLAERLGERLVGDGEGGRAVAGGPPAPLLDRALLLAADAAPTTAHALARRLADEHLAAHPFDPAGLLTAAEVLGRQAPFVFATVRDVRVLLPNPPDPTSDTGAVIATIVDTARALVRRAGGGRIADVTGRVAAELAVWVDDDLVTAVVAEPDDFVWLERRTGWFTLTGVARNAVATRVIKVLSVAGAIDVAELHAGIRRDERMRDFVMPEYILAELCERIPGVGVADGHVRSLRPIVPEDVLEATELTLVRVLRAHEGPLPRRELEQLCRAEGMKPASFNNRITYSPIIADHGRGRFGLRSGHGRAAGAWGATAPPSGDSGPYRPPRR